MDNSLFAAAFEKPLALAALGGFMLNMINLYDDSKRPRNEQVPRDVIWAVFFVFWPLAGAALAYVYLLDGSTLRPFLAFSVGLSAPTTLQTLIKTARSGPGSPPNSEE